MKIYGCLSEDDQDSRELEEITFQASPQELEKIANFLLKYARVMNQQGSTFEHAHLADEGENWIGNPDIIVFQKN